MDDVGDNDELWDAIKRATRPLFNKKKPKDPSPKYHRVKARSPLMPIAPILSPSPSRKMARLKRPVQFARIDLHDLTLSHAEIRLFSYLQTCQLKKERWVLVITGKSHFARKNGQKTLQNTVPQWLNAWGHIVSFYGESKPQDGGAGALYVHLKAR